LREFSSVAHIGFHYITNEDTHKNVLSVDLILFAFIVLLCSKSAMMTADLPDPGLARVATESGGGYLEIGPRDDLRAAFARVADELHSQYLLGFLPPKRDGKEHDLDVRVSARGLEPRARKSYVAPKDSGTPPSDRR
jgi:hypothetical protein